MLLSHNKDQKRVQLEIIILSDASKKEKDKYHMISLKCGI